MFLLCTSESENLEFLGFIEDDAVAPQVGVKVDVKDGDGRIAVGEGGELIHRQAAPVANTAKVQNVGESIQSKDAHISVG